MTNNWFFAVNKALLSLKHLITNISVYYALNTRSWPIYKPGIFCGSLKEIISPQKPPMVDTYISLPVFFCWQCAFKLVNLNI